ncbi:MAG: TraB/GumN family protein [Gammaproteobacteria bacterium]|nr:MAG: TraB/GumN family protein [Gammaproteobacteria bacterium]
MSKPISLYSTLLRLAIVLLVCFPVLSVHAVEQGANTATLQGEAPAPASSHHSDAPYSKGLLWKISRDHGKPSYIFGTMHSDDVRVTELPPQVHAVFTRSSSFTMEVIADAQGIETLSRAMFLPPGERLVDVLGQELYTLTKKTILAHGLSTEKLEQIKPWVIIMMLSMPKPDSGIFLDMKLYLDALAQRKQSFGLETMEEQIAVFDKLPLPDQITLLRETLAESSNITQLFEQMVQAYLDRDLAAIQSLSYQHMTKDDRLQDTLTELLLIQRNWRMLERMQPQIREGNAFIAVGALHLPGEQGLLALLVRSGYHVTPIY